MNKLVLIPIIIGGVLLTAGAVALGIGLSTAVKEEKVTNTYELNEEFNNFDFDLSTAMTEFKVSEDSSKKVIIDEIENYQHTVTVSENTLKIVHSNERQRWFEGMFGFNNFKIKVTVYLPAGTYGELKYKGATGDVVIPADYAFDSANIKVSTGDVHFNGVVANTFKCEVSTGDVTLNGVKAKDMNLKSSTGYYILNNVEVETSIVADQDTGNLTLKNCKAQNLDLKTSTGRKTLENVEVEEKINLKASTGDTVINDVKCKNFESNSSTGDVKLTNLLVNEHIEIKTSTGDVDFLNSDAATLHIKTGTGHVKGNLLTDHVFYATCDTGTPKVPHSTTGGLCEIETDTGSINITVGAK